ncbi:hypothetical protein M409DRAFT_20813 [Zasmidium cellare ATCC 36951]|uniref:Uncharacterized protein n=1 Tax=Zasmidium cellare ATCC 36951 TaxID=1080233 RepID=A0A6A6CND8_ZASCE|nr:uncharacterized protein M409DRAFT_20813 [Zasmidium cellare ATCC 36951]KAF2168797.1 hypothetical protein M409DRAFT_20813 [Zasmidium cellare ATCC 36951]
MTPTNARLGVLAVLRMTAPRSLQSLTQSAANAGLDGNSLSPWYNSQFGTDPIDPSTATGPQLSVVNGAAQASFLLSQETNDGSGFLPAFQVRAVQTFRIPQGYFYFVLADVAVTSQGDTSCGVSFAAENAGLPSLFLNPGESYVGSVNGSGTMAFSESTYVSFSASCQGHADATVRIDNFVDHTDSDNIIVGEPIHLFNRKSIHDNSRSIYLVNDDYFAVDIKSINNDGDPTHYIELRNIFVVFCVYPVHRI